MFRVEVVFKDPALDARGPSIKKQIEQDLGLNIVALSVRDVYYIDAPLTDDRIDLVAQDLLTDPVLQNFSLGAPPAAGVDWAIEVGYLPGVTDNVGRTTAEAIADMPDLLGVRSQESGVRRAGGHVIPAEAGIQEGAGDFVRTATVYAISGRLTEAQAERLCLGVLANPLIHAYKIMASAEYARAAWSAPNPPSAHKPQIKTVDLPDDDAGLERLSRDGLLSLTVAEMRAIKAYFARPETAAARLVVGLTDKPTDIELETLAQTWSEHCKHKIFNSRITYTEPGAEPVVIDSLFKTYIKRATDTVAKEIDWLVSVFSDNAGVVRLNDKYNLVFKVETHNHPSALDPYGGALTGIVGVNRDPMGTGLGAELIFNTDVFCFGPPDMAEEALPPGILHPRRIFRGVRKGVEDGGNKMGVPTVNGTILFDDAYTYNPLVFCGTGGIMPGVIGGAASHEKSVKPGDLIVMVGGRIGKDGIHGATFSSVKLEETTPPAVVQIGAPIVQKKMMDALIDARDRGLYRAITDNGAGGLSSSIGEMAQFCGGAQVDLEKAPLKYSGLDPWETWVSESQERMTLAVAPETIDELMALFNRRDVEATVIGSFADDGYLTVRYDGVVAARLDLDWLHSGLPRLELEARWEPPETPSNQTVSIEPSIALLRILGSLNVCSKESVIRQYDHEVQGTSVVKPLVGVVDDGPSDAAVLKPRADAAEGVVVACGINPKYGLIDPYDMAAAAVDEAVRNAVAVGADPGRISILDNFCWGNPIKSDHNPDGDLKLGRLVRAAQGCHDAAVALGAPFISGKDSFHNEYDLGGRTIAIPPTLLISAMGVIEDTGLAVTMDAKREGDLVYALGLTKVEMGGSHYSGLTGLRGGAPRFAGAAASATYRAVHEAIKRRLIASAHDCSEGGLAVALAETAFAGGLGVVVNMRRVKTDGFLSDVECLFSESNSRFVVTVKPANAGEFETTVADTSWSKIGKVTNTGRLVVTGLDDRVVIDISTDELKKAWQEPLKWV
ncbi:MAG: phosphoribosylformylglycinamidine synthase subunit PurL [Actinomycetota bacterium]|nr:phosphoribosylformylglycinamidine synthase subunit PurL [Actinomycetota bacterium]